MESDKISFKQKIQDEEYGFPYHYVAKYDPNFSQCFLDTWGINYVATIEFLLDRISKEQINSIIDIGCGDGRFTAELSKAFPDVKVIGIDYSKRAINIAKAINPEIQFDCKDIIASDYKQEFSAGVLMEVLEHIPPRDVKMFLRGVSDLLCNEGLLFITVPHSNKPVEYKHFQHFTVESLLNELNSFFEPCEIIPFEKVSIRKRIIDKFLANKYYILNHKKTLNYIYKYYKKKLFSSCSERDCQRIYMLLKKRHTIED